MNLFDTGQFNHVNTTGDIYMQLERLVVNGCSYMEQYAMGHGHYELAETLGLRGSESLAIGGSCNSRIIRSTLRHSYRTQYRCCYVIGLTFLGRTELPIAPIPHEQEGRWISIQNQFDPSRPLQKHLMPGDIDEYIKFKIKTEFESIDDRVEDLQYRLVSMVNDLKSRGHACVIYNQADDIYQQFLDLPQMQLLQIKEIIQGLKWIAVPWQWKSGTKMTDDHFNLGIPEHLRHPAVGAHGNINQFLADYIGQHQLVS
jgi:hypothetical protein